MKNIIFYSVMIGSIFLFILSVVFIMEADKKLIAADNINKDTVRITSNMSSIISGSPREIMIEMKTDRVNQYVKTLSKIGNDKTISIMLEVYQEGYEQGFNDLLYTFIR